jgi:hypothetical protein
MGPGSTSIARCSQHYGSNSRFKRHVKSRLGALALVLLATLPLGASPASSDPYEIFARAKNFWLVQRYPGLIRYRVAVDIIEGGKERVEHYDTVYDAVNDRITVDPVSDYEREHPVYPTGVDFNLFGAIHLNKPLPAVDFLGVPHLAPNYSFGMAPFVPAPSPTPFNSMALVEEIRREFHDPNPHATPTPAPSPTPPIPEIASVVAFRRDYTIALVGTQTIDGHDCYHLQLQPNHDPGKFRLRQAWIDERSYATWELVEALNFKDGPGTTVPWTIHFANVDGAQYVREEDANESMSTEGEIYTAAAVRFEDVHAVSRSEIDRPLQESGQILQEP